MPAAANAAAALHARLDAAKRRVQSDLAAGSRRPPRLSRQPRTRGRRAESSATTRVVPDRLSPPRRAPAAAPRTPAASPPPPRAPANSSDEDDSPSAIRYRELQLEQEAASRERQLLLDRVAAVAVSDDAHADDDVGAARGRALAQELADQAERRQRLLTALDAHGGSPPRSTAGTPGGVGGDRLARLARGQPDRAPPSPTWQPAEAAPPQAPSLESARHGGSGSGGDKEEDEKEAAEQAVQRHEDDSDSDGSALPGLTGDSQAAARDRSELTSQLRGLWHELSALVHSRHDYGRLIRMVRDAAADFWEWISSCRRNGAVDGAVDFVRFDDLVDDVAGCFNDSPMTPADCRPVLGIVVRVLQEMGFHRSLQQGGRRHLARCLSFDPSPRTLGRLETGLAVVAGLVTEADIDAESRVSPKSGAETKPLGTPPSALSVERESVALVAVPSPAPEEDRVDMMSQPEGGDQAIKPGVELDADEAAEMLLDELLDNTVLEINALEQQRQSEKAAPSAAASDEVRLPLNVTPMLQQLDRLAQQEADLVAKYRVRDAPLPAALSSANEPLAGSAPAPTPIRTERKVGTDAAAAFVDARLALAGRHYDTKLVVKAFESWKTEAAGAPHLATIMFALTAMKIKLMLPQWRRITAVRIRARIFAEHSLQARTLAVMCSNTRHAQDLRIAATHRADVQLCQAILCWHDYMQQQQLRDRDLYANLAHKVRLSQIRRSWSAWRDAENRLLALVHSRRSLVFAAVHRWHRAVGVLQDWRKRWLVIVYRLAFTSWRRYCAQSATAAARSVAAESQFIRASLQSHLTRWRRRATVQRRLRQLGQTLQTRVDRRVQHFGLATLRYGAMLSRHCRLQDDLQCRVVLRAWAAEVKLVGHSKSRAWEAWKVFVGMARLETWLAHVRYTIHGRWVVVDCFYEWKRRVLVWAHGRNLQADVNAAAKSRYLQRWRAAYAARVSSAGAAGDSTASTAEIAGPQDTSQAPSSSEGSVKIDGQDAPPSVETLVAQGVAEARAQLEQQYETLHNALEVQQRGVLSDIKTDLGALNLRLASLGLLSPATMELLQRAPAVDGAPTAQAVDAPKVASRQREAAEEDAAAKEEIDAKAAAEAADKLMAQAKKEEEEARVAAEEEARVEAEGEERRRVQAETARVAAEEEQARVAAEAERAQIAAAEEEAARVAAAEAERCRIAAAEEAARVAAVEEEARRQAAETARLEALAAAEHARAEVP